MKHRILAALAIAAVPALAWAQDRASPAPAPGPGHETRRQVDDAARDAGQALRRGWERTKHAARQASDAMDEGWRTIEHGVRWGWNHPHGDADQPPR